MSIDRSTDGGGGDDDDDDDGGRRRSRTARHAHDGFLRASTLSQDEANHFKGTCSASMRARERRWATGRARRRAR